MKILRPHFDAACATLSGDLYIRIDQRDAIWHALTSTRLAPLPRERPPRWTPEALALLEPLRLELEALRQHERSGSIAKRYAGIHVTLPRPGHAQPQQFIVMHVYAQYRERLHALNERIKRVLKENGHWCTSAKYDEHAAAGADTLALRQPIEVIVANETAAERHAGVRDWVQWENPSAVRAITRVFDEARAVTGHGAKPGRQWAPYIPTSGKPGAAEQGKAFGKWRGAFHDAIHNPLDTLSSTIGAGPLLRFYERLKTPAVQACIETAIRTQVKLRRGPTNQAFRISIWHALDTQSRLELAAQFDAALRECTEVLSAKGLDAAEFSPAVVPNPWAVGEAQETKPAEVAAKYDEPASTDDEPEDETAHPDESRFDDLMSKLDNM